MRIDPGDSDRFRAREICRFFLRKLLFVDFLVCRALGFLKKFLALSSVIYLLLILVLVIVMSLVQLWMGCCWWCCIISLNINSFLFTFVAKCKGKVNLPLRCLSLLLPRSSPCLETVLTLDFDDDQMR